MAARTQRLALLLCLLVMTGGPRGSVPLTGAAAQAPNQPQSTTGDQTRRIVSLVPSLTEILFAIGAGPSVVGVDSFSNYPPDVEKLPRVGALVDPDVERILALRERLRRRRLVTTMKLSVFVDCPRAPFSACEVKLPIEHADVEFAAA